MKQHPIYQWIMVMMILGTGLVTSVRALSLYAYGIPVSSPAKGSSTITGLYGHLGFYPYSAEFEFDKTSMTGTENGQQNAIFVFSDNHVPYSHFRIGFNQVQPTNGTPGATVFVGALFDQYDYYYNLNAQVGGSVYTSFFTLSNGEKLTVLQVSPEFTSYFWSAVVPGRLSVTTKGSIQFLSANAGSGTQFFGGEIAISDTNGPFSLTAKSYFGSNQFGAYENGYVVYNTQDVYATGYSVTGKLYFSPSMFLSTGYQMFDFTPSGSSSKSTISRTTIMIGLNL